MKPSSLGLMAIIIGVISFSLGWLSHDADLTDKWLTFEPSVIAVPVYGDVVKDLVPHVTGLHANMRISNTANGGAEFGYIVTVDSEVLGVPDVQKQFFLRYFKQASWSDVEKNLYYEFQPAFEVRDRDGFTISNVVGEPFLVWPGQKRVAQAIAKQSATQLVKSRAKSFRVMISLNHCYYSSAGKEMTCPQNAKLPDGFEIPQ